MKKRFVVFVHLIPAMVSLLLIGAHFLRSGNFLVMVVSLLLILALGIREPLVAWAVQGALLLATAEWVHVAYGLVGARLEAGLPWTKLVCILGGVAALTLTAIALFRAKALTEMYHLAPASAPDVPAMKDVTMVEPTHRTTQITPTEQGAEREQRQRLLAVYHLKTNLTTASLLTFLLMNFSTAVGMVALIAIGIINSGLRTKMRAIGGTLSPDEKKSLYVRQTVGLCLLATPIIAFYSYSLPAVIQPLIVGSIITVFTLLLWALARYEYLYLGREG
jgi:hypothetical protein